MVDKSYMLAQPAPSSLAKIYFDQTVLPVAIDLAGCMEAGLERLSVSVKQRPMVVLGAALIIGAAVSSITIHLLTSRHRLFRR